jgi:hypothetical protein
LHQPERRFCKTLLKLASCAVAARLFALKDWDHAGQEATGTHEAVGGTRLLLEFEGAMDGRIRGELKRLGYSGCWRMTCARFPGILETTIAGQQNDYQ